MTNSFAKLNRAGRLDAPGIFRKPCSPHAKPRPANWPEGKEYVDDGFANDVERLFNKLALENGVVCEIEQTCFGTLDDNLTEFYRPDARIQLWNAEAQEFDEYFVEIHGAVKWRRKQYDLGTKRKKIRWLSQRTGIPVILLHLHNWEEPRNDWSVIEALAAEAKAEAHKVHQEFLAELREQGIPKPEVVLLAA